MVIQFCELISQYIRASISGNTKLFLIADPLIVGYQEFSLKEITTYADKYKLANDF
jgi:hypothetical protein